MADPQQPRGVHLNGSTPLANTGEVLRVSNGILGARLRRIPDGETGERSNWMRWQDGVFADFGVATECGFGRWPAETISERLRIHSAVAAPR